MKYEWPINILNNARPSLRIMEMKTLRTEIPFSPIIMRTFFCFLVLMVGEGVAGGEYSLHCWWK